MRWSSAFPHLFVSSALAFLAKARRGRWRRTAAQLIILVVIAFLGLAVSESVRAGSLTVSDVSPNMAFAAPVHSPIGDASGRIQKLLVDPFSDKVLYAVSVGAGVWKSTDAGHSWQQASAGINNAYSGLGDYATNELLAVDQNNNKRLIYASGADDARPNKPYGGLYVTTDGAANWRHAELTGQTGGLCPAQSLLSVIFDSGQPFVATPCGLFTNADPGLADAKWTKLPMPPFLANGHASPVHMAPNSYGREVFACQDRSVYISLDLGQSWKTFDLGTGDVCNGLSVAPLAEFVPSTVAVIYSIPPKSNTNCYQTKCEVALLNGGTGKITKLGFGAAGGGGGGGVASITTVRRASAQQFDARPGIAYDIYAANTWYFFQYAVAANGKTSWKEILGSGGHHLHVDAWSMAFPSSYDPPNGHCTAYASNDGGIDINNASGATSCDPTSGWVSAMSGLHVLETYTIAGVSQASPQPGCSASSPCPTLYLANGDNDVWETSGSQSGPIHSGNDAGQVYVDPAYPQQLFFAFGKSLDVARSATASAPLPGATLTDVTPKNWAVGPVASCSGCWGPGIANTVQAMALSSETASAATYFALQRPSIAPDGIVTATISGSAAPTWTAVETGNAKGLFGDDVLQLKASGGITNPILWVVTGHGKVFQGSVVNGQVAQWVSVSGGGSTGIGEARALFVNPYNFRYAWVLDRKDPSTNAPSIKATSDGGGSWTTADTLKNIATNVGEFRFGGSDNLFDWTCSLAWMSFSRQHPNIAVAALFPGGVAYSNSSGQTWAVLPDVTSGPTPAPANNLRGYPIAVWYDDNPLFGKPSIYVSLHSNRTLRVDGDFDALPAQ